MESGTQLVYLGNPVPFYKKKPLFLLAFGIGISAAKITPLSYSFQSLVATHKAVNNL